MYEEDQESTGVSIRAGFPNPATDKSLQSLDLNKLLIAHGTSTYMFRVAGGEWEKSGVFAGDIAVVDRALGPRKNDVVLWWDGQMGEFAVSAFHAMPPDASVWGVVTATIHQFRKVNR